MTEEGVVDVVRGELGGVTRVRLQVKEEVGEVGRAKVRMAVKRCEQCVEVAEKVPAALPAVTHHVAVVTGQPLDVKWQRIVLSRLRKWGVGRDDVAWINAVSCVTATDRPPRHMADNCRDHALAQIRAANTPYLLLIGADAVRLWRSDIMVTKDCGLFGAMGGTWLVTVAPHPDGLHRYDRSFVETVDALGEASTSGWPTSWLGTRCVACRREGGDEPVRDMDSDGLAWCAGHLVKDGGGKRKRRKKGQPVEGQIGMEF